MKKFEYKNKKGWIRKIHPFESCFVRIKVLPHECKPDVYQRIATVFRLLSPHRLPSFCTVLRPPARFACAAAVSPCMTVQR